MKNKWAFFLHQSPPIHGAALVGDSIAEFVGKNEPNTAVFNLSMHTHLSQHARLSLKKVLTLIVLFLNMLQSVVNGARYFYYTPSVSKAGVCKDLIVLAPFLVMKILRPSSYKILFHIHSAGLEIVYKESSIFFRWLMRQIYSDCYFLALCEYHKEQLSIFGQKTFVLFNHAPEIELDEVETTLRDEGKNFLFLSNIFKSKGIFDAIKFFKSLNIKGKKLNIAGPFIENECSEVELREFVERNQLSDCVDILGPIFGIEKEELFKKSDVLLFPTRYHNEMFPLVVLEALAHGLFVVTLPTAGIPEMINEKFCGDMKFDVSTQRYLEVSWEDLLDERLVRKRYAQERFSKQQFEMGFRGILENIDDDH